jgi:hypothetical protein
MRHQGGFQIVLLKAKGGEDWIVMKDMNPYIKWKALSSRKSIRVQSKNMARAAVKVES